VKLLFLLTLGCVALAGPATQAYQSKLRITVRVLNPARVPTGTAAEAERTAADIFKKAGVEIGWVDCETSDACRREAGRLEFWLHLLERQPAALSGDALGYALLTHEPCNKGSYAAVSWQPVRHMADSMEIGPGPILGAAIAHELGHLLLDSHSHSHDGVMAERLRTPQLMMAARGELRFDDYQAEAIRREIRRAGAANPGANPGYLDKGAPARPEGPLPCRPFWGR
jgi:hypothetical protein